MEENRNKIQKLRHFGISENTRESYWRISKSPILSRSLDNKTIADLGYITLTDYYLKISKN